MKLLTIAVLSTALVMSFSAQAQNEFSNDTNSGVDCNPISIMDDSIDCKLEENPVNARSFVSGALLRPTEDYDNSNTSKASVNNVKVLTDYTANENVVARRFNIEKDRVNNKACTIRKGDIIYNISSAIGDNFQRFERSAKIYTTTPEHKVIRDIKNNTYYCDTDDLIVISITLIKSGFSPIQ
jgi:hypothetical protein